jgi:hypothetical protein
MSTYLHVFEELVKQERSHVPACPVRELSFQQGYRLLALPQCRLERGNVRGCRR